MTDSDEFKGLDFIRQIIGNDLASGKHDTVVTRFPPEPNGYLHIGHAKSICLNFGVAEEFGGKTYLRFDDTNPLKEEQNFVDSIIEDVRWLGYDFEDRLTYTSDYFQQLYECAEKLIHDGKAYVDSLSATEIRDHRGTLTAPGTDSPYRDRDADENLDFFQRMRAGEFAEGEHVLRARIDMASPNINLRDPTLYRIRKTTHQRTGDKWPIYPMYDFALTIADALEGVTHSLCTLEFEDHRTLYDWILDQLDLPHRPRQIEFSRLNLAYTVMSKRRLAELIELGQVSGWDDPRMPTLAGMRRRGFPAAAIRDFCDRVGVTKKENFIEMSVLENSVREELDDRAPRVMAVLQPLKIVLTNYPEGQTEMLPAANHPNKPEMGTRELAFGRELYIEREDFMEDPPRKFFRLRPGGEVRLRYAYIIKCEKVIKDDDGEIVELHCSYDPETRSGSEKAQRKVKGTIHWVAREHSARAEIRLYDRLFSSPRPGFGEDKLAFTESLNPESLTAVTDGRVEASLSGIDPQKEVQFERVGYFVADDIDSQPGRPVFNRIVTLRDSWAKIERAQQSKA